MKEHNAYEIAGKIVINCVVPCGQTVADKIATALLNATNEAYGKMADFMVEQTGGCPHDLIFGNESDICDDCLNYEHSRRCWIDYFLSR